MKLTNKMSLIRLKSRTNIWLNNGKLLTYFMALSYLCIFYFVSSADFDNHSSSRSIKVSDSKIVETLNNRNSFNVNNNFNSKKLLNFNNQSKNNKRIVVLNKVYSSPRHRRKSSVANKNNIQIEEPNGNFYNLKNKTAQYFSQIYQDRILVYLLNNSFFNEKNASENGLFIEAGAFDGETWSNTLYLEKFKNWNGILVEPSKEIFKLLKHKNRRAYLVNSCLCSGDFSKNSTFIEAGPFGITTNLSSTKTSNSPVVECHPLAKIINEFFDSHPKFKLKKSRISEEVDKSKKTIDYLSLDVEGSEKPIIQTFPWNEIKFNFLNIEYNQDQSLYKWLKSYLGKFGYVEILFDDVWHQDIFLAHESIFNQLNRNFTKMSYFIVNQPF
jgi:hypothetical protein